MLLAGTIASYYCVLLYSSTSDLESVQSPVAIEESFPWVTVLQIIPDEATVLIDLPYAEESIKVLKTEMDGGILKIAYGDCSQHIPIFADKSGSILRSEYLNDRVLVEILSDR